MKDARTSEQYAQTVLENVVVHATGKITASTNVNLLPEKDRAYSRVSLLVTGEGAERLALLKELSFIVLSLRNPEDGSRLGAHPRTTQQGLKK